jgi:hypothetical protein
VGLHEKMYATTVRTCSSVSGPPISFHHAPISVPGMPAWVTWVDLLVRGLSEELLRVERRRADPSPSSP